MDLFQAVYNSSFTLEALYASQARWSLPATQSSATLPSAVECFFKSERKKPDDNSATNFFETERS